MALGLEPTLREQCAQLRDKRLGTDSPAYGRAVAAVDKLTAALLVAGSALRAEILGALKAREPDRQGLLDDTLDVIGGSGLTPRIFALKSAHRRISDQFLEYDQTVSECVKQIGTGWETELFTGIEFLLRAQQVAAVHDNVRGRLDDLRHEQASLENERGVRIARSLSILSLVSAFLSVFLVGVQIVLARRQNRLVLYQIETGKQEAELNRAALERLSDGLSAQRSSTSVGLFSHLLDRLGRIGTWFRER